MKKLCFLLLAALSASCSLGPQIDMAVNSLAAPNSSTNAKYVLYSGSDTVPGSDLQFREYANFVHRGLASRGFVEVDDLSNADIAIFLVYGVGDPMTWQYTYSTPVWGQTGISSSETSGTISTYGNTSSYSENTTYNPSYGVTGYDSGVAQKTVFFLSMQVAAIDVAKYNAGEPNAEVWKTVVGCFQETPDLRAVFPVLVAGGVPHFASSSGKQIPVRLGMNDSEVVYIRGN